MKADRYYRMTVETVNTSIKKGTAKHPVSVIELDREGVVGDAHRSTPRRNVSLLDRTLVEELTASTGIERIPEGAMGENITCRIIGSDTPRVGDRILIGEVLLLVEKIGKECHGDGCAIFRRIGRCVMPSAGIFCSVLTGGKVESGMTGELIRG